MEINPAEGTETLTLDAQLDPGLTLRIKVVDAEGKPVPDASVEGGNRMRAGAATPDALFELASFRPDEVRSVVIRHDGRKLGKVVRVRAGDDAKGPVVVTLEPLATIKARVVDADGNPVPGATLRVDVEPTEGFIHQFTSVGSDRDGRFVVPERADRVRIRPGGRGRYDDQGAPGRLQQGHGQARRDDRRRRHQVQERLSGTDRPRGRLVS